VGSMVSSRLNSALVERMCWPGLGRTPRRADEPRVRMAYTMYQAQQLSVTEICATLQLSQATFYRYVALGKRAAEASGMA
jgi:hypothetical protein